MERLTIPDEKIEGGVRRAVIDAREVKKNAMTIYWTLKKYEDIGLILEQVWELVVAKLLDRPFTTDKKRQILNMLHRNINRILVSNDIEEIVCQLNFAADRLYAVVYLRIKVLTERSDDK